jgi:hypothetical protein
MASRGPVNIPRENERALAATQAYDMRPNGERRWLSRASSMNAVERTADH